MNTKDNVTSIQIVKEIPEDAALQDKLSDALVPGFQAEFDPDEADKVGAFVEDALSEQDALESGVDLLNLTNNN
ncbi:MAG: conjugal transfer protein TraD [Methyloglobulus sp.]|jgi:hypothetical protein|nr:conjugal transfer protein TraD [Methyloglobulus sp.]